MYWCLSIIDYYSYTGETAILRLYQEQLMEKLSRALQQVAHVHQSLRFVGWDDRTGAWSEW
jgi:hypothetical protein